MTTELVIEAIRNDQNLSTPNNLKFPCSICNKNVLKNQKAIQCDGTPIETYNKLMLSEEDSWQCLLCKVKFHQYNFPFTLCDDTGIQNLKQLL